MTHILLDIIYILPDLNHSKQFPKTPDTLSNFETFHNKQTFYKTLAPLLIIKRGERGFVELSWPPETSATKKKKKTKNTKSRQKPKGQKPE